MATKVLVGFSELLDRRRLHFVQEQPQHGACTFCDSLARHLYTLGCSHAFCDVCYGQLIVQATNDRYVCPLDNRAIEPEDVIVSELKLEDLGAVFCPNKSAGCAVSGSIVETLERHFPECEYHQVNCVRCSTPVRHLDILQHAASCTGTPQAPAAEASGVVRPSPDEGGSEQQTDQLCSSGLSVLPETAKSAEADVDTSIVKLQSIQSAIISLRNEVQSLIRERVMSTAPFGAQRTSSKTLLPRSSQERLNEATDAYMADFQDFVNREMDKRLVKYFGPARDSDGERDDVLGRLDRLEQKLTVLQVKTSKTKSFWHVTGFEAFKSEADAETQIVSRFSSPILISGYTVKLQVDMDKSDPSGAWLGMFATLLRGPTDEFLDWPLKKPLLFTLVHPESARRNVKKHLIPGARKDLLSCFSRPSDANQGCGFDRLIAVHAMDHEGFVHNDAFTVALSIRQTAPPRLAE